ncbi:hypothetical protein GUJ93_ZPchr0013g37267 [Zizania palustris]|uniref:Uncharacterized protein n=1 Tax=Zizania palustris TaxID=103762 RepID=A0A8J5X261_ZIZPA|nr:hypothetical protein GUJ93_ZPchr0013g37267 [Zizania palustris]
MELNSVSVLEHGLFEQASPACSQRAIVIFRELLAAAYTPALPDHPQDGGSVVAHSRAFRSQTELEPSFALNLFLDGYPISNLGKGMLLFLISDDPEKHPYNRASKALFYEMTS